VINGQKIWTSYANVADYCFLLARTSRGDDRHQGVSILIVPMSSPGIEVREIRALVHEHAFHEVFFRDVRVPVSALLGPEGQAWRVIADTLAYERVGSPRYARAALLLDLVAAWAANNGRDDEAVAVVLGRARAACEAARLLTMWVIDERAKRRTPSSRAYVARVAMVRAEREVASAALDVMGAESTALDSLADMQFRGALAAGIAAGAYEIQLNLVARRCLGFSGG
jgi:alkylation response protein AidB-like acyl-CoA dehydrogenase